MPDHPPRPLGQVLRHFTVAVFVVEDGRVLLHFHRRLGKWLPPGGHVEADELPDDAALREVEEETGLLVRLVGGRGLALDEPRQLVVPAGVQVESIYPGHEHIDLVYFAVPAARSQPIGVDYQERDRVGWYASGQLAELGASEEIQAWARRALAEVSPGDGN
ncbi:MAG: NUDIX domain-containing protein [Chloroflexi bacterium]|nr:NUDIX domain-containing protein [Chloroflexota bacterium]